MLRRPKHSKNEVVVPKEEEEELRAQQQYSFFITFPAAMYEPFCKNYYKYCTFLFV